MAFTPWLQCHGESVTVFIFHSFNEPNNRNAELVEFFSCSRAFRTWFSSLSFFLFARCRVCAYATLRVFFSCYCVAEQVPAVPYNFRITCFIHVGKIFFSRFFSVIQNWIRMKCSMTEKNINCMRWFGLVGDQSSLVRFGVYAMSQKTGFRLQNFAFWIYSWCSARQMVQNLSQTKSYFFVSCSAAAAAVVSNSEHCAVIKFETSRCASDDFIISYAHHVQIA